jgi:hypothetical protein
VNNRRSTDRWQKHQNLIDPGGGRTHPSFQVLPMSWTKCVTYVLTQSKAFSLNVSPSIVSLQRQPPQISNLKLPVPLFENPISRAHTSHSSYVS